MQYNNCDHYWEGCRVLGRKIAQQINSPHSTIAVSWNRMTDGYLLLGRRLRFVLERTTVVYKTYIIITTFTYSTILKQTNRKLPWASNHAGVVGDQNGKAMLRDVHPPRSIHYLVIRSILFLAWFLLRCRCSRRLGYRW